MSCHVNSLVKMVKKCVDEFDGRFFSTDDEYWLLVGT